MRKATAAKPAPAPEADEAPELVVDREFKSPQPLDRNICTVSLKTPTNDVTEGYDLHMSATFGKERVKLVSDDFVIEVDFSMNKVNIELSFHRCDHAEINENPRVEEYKRTITQHGGQHTSTLAKLAGRLTMGAAGPTGKADASGSVQRSATASTTTKQEIVRHDWHRLGTDAIVVGPTGNHLQGPMITDFRGWHVTPHDASDISGVIARIKVREPWDKFRQSADPEAPARPFRQGQELHERPPPQAIFHAPLAPSHDADRTAQPPERHRRHHRVTRPFGASA